MLSLFYFLKKSKHFVALKWLVLLQVTSGSLEIICNMTVGMMVRLAFARCAQEVQFVPGLARACARWAITPALHCLHRSSREPHGRWGENTSNHICLFCARGHSLWEWSWVHDQKWKLAYTYSFRRIPDGLQEWPLILKKTPWQGSYYYPPCNWEGKGEVWMDSFLKMTQVVGVSGGVWTWSIQLHYRGS